MSIKKLIENLEEWHENAISELCADDKLTCDDLCGCRSDCIVLQAIKALRVLADQEDPAPLTLEELLQMEGEPVWVKHWHGGEWIIVYWDYVERIAYTRQACLHKHEYGESWIAYRSKPKEAERC